MLLSHLSGLVLCFVSLSHTRPTVENEITQRQPASYFYKGHDLSSLLLLEEAGAVYHDSAQHNATRPAEDILGDGGMNTVRLRLAA